MKGRKDKYCDDSKADEKSLSQVSLKDFPQDDLYRLFVDAKKVEDEKGWALYEGREPGCLKALCEAARVAWFKNIENPELSEDLIKELHKWVTTDVKQLNSDDFKPGEYRKNTTGFGFRTITQEGLFDIFSLIQRQKNANYDSKENQKKTLEDYRFIYKNSKLQDEKKTFKPYAAWFFPETTLGNTGSCLSVYDTGIFAIPRLYNTCSMNTLYQNCLGVDNRKHAASLKNEKEKLNFLTGTIAHSLYELSYRAPAPHVVPLEMKTIIQSYNARIKTAETTDQKIQIIADTIWDFEHVHPFRDGNIRVFAILLCNRLLIQNELGLAIFQDPNIFDNHGKTEVATAIKDAIQKTKNLITNKEEAKGFDTSDISKENLEKFRAWSVRLYSLAQGEEKYKDNDSGQSTIVSSSIPVLINPNKLSTSEKILLGIGVGFLIVGAVASIVVTAGLATIPLLLTVGAVIGGIGGGLTTFVGISCSPFKNWYSNQNTFTKVMTWLGIGILSLGVIAVTGGLALVGLTGIGVSQAMATIFGANMMAANTVGTTALATTIVTETSVAISAASTTAKLYRNGMVGLSTEEENKKEVNNANNSEISTLRSKEDSTVDCSQSVMPAQSKLS